MKVGIILIIIGSILLTGNLIYLVIEPMWAFIFRLIISAGTICIGIFRIYYKQSQREVKQ